MRRNLDIGKVNLDFLDGVIHSTINDLLRAEGPTDSGLFGFYADRVHDRLGGLLEYKEDVARYLIEHCAGRRVVEVGTGLGELPIVLALNGVTCAGLEYHEARSRAAANVRRRVASIFPELEDRYEFIYGGFPEAPAGPPWIGSDVTLLFTNVGAGWDQDRVDRSIARFAAFGEVILDLTLFGEERQDDADRQALFDRIAARSDFAERIADLSLGTDYARFVFTPRAGLGERIGRIFKR